MKEYPNFYENLAEAVKRLEGTVVKYGNDFYYVLCITDHKNDGIFRIYLDDLKDLWLRKAGDIPYGGHVPNRGKAMDDYIVANPNCGIIRKQLNSPLFNKFRPFPIGMINCDGQAIYVERSPVRHTQQGLTSQMLVGRQVTITNNERSYNIDIYSAGLYQTLTNSYPTFEECCSNLLDKSILNPSVAFHRNFAVLRGPINTLFVAHKNEVVGFLPALDSSVIVLGQDFTYLKEVIESLNIFQEVK